MKLVIEVTGYDHGKYESDGEKSTWARLTGKNSSGSICRAVFFESVAEALVRDLARHIPKGEEIGATRIVIDMTGEWRDGKEFTRNDGTKGKLRSFYATTFDILTGPVLELARLRRDGADRLALAEQHRQEGRMDLAYRTVAEFAAMICNRPLDLSGLDEVDAADEAEFGATSMVDSDPESAAAARFASMDGVAEPMEIAPELQLAEIAMASDESVEAADAAEEEVDTDEPQDAPVEEEADVLDDEPAVAPAAAKPAAVPASAVPAKPAVAVPGRPVPPRPGFRVPPPPRSPGM